MSNQRSRMNKFDKRRKMTKMTSILFIVGSILAILFISTFIFGNKSDKNVVEKNNETKALTEEKQTNEAMIIKEQQDNTDTDDFSEEDNTEFNQDEEDLELEKVASSDENVIEAYKGNWQPIGTSQSEPHSVDYNANSKDRVEMERAIELATGLHDMIIWWIGNAGDQNVVSTVSSTDNAQTYRVYLSWETNRGWQPTLVEVLKVNDKK